MKWISTGTKFLIPLLYFHFTFNILYEEMCQNTINKKELLAKWLGYIVYCKQYFRLLFCFHFQRHQFIVLSCSKLHILDLFCELYPQSDAPPLSMI